MKFLITSFMVLLVSAVFAQERKVITYIGTEPLGAKITAKNIAPWLVKQSSDYTGTYHFGFSECESEFELKVANGATTASESHYDIPTSGKPRHIIRKFAGVRIMGNKFYSNQVNGEFVYVTVDGEKLRGLKVYKSWSCNQPVGTAEVGPRDK